MDKPRSPFLTPSLRVTSPYGRRPALGDYHCGIDMTPVGGDMTVCAVMAGTVVRSRIVTDTSVRTWEWGNYVAVAQEDGIVAYYCHLASRAAEEGDILRAGDRIGVMGDTGLSYGVHLHFEVRRRGTVIDPAAYLGIKNAAGEAVIYAASDADEVCRICGLERRTREYIDGYEYAADLWRKLRSGMSKE